MDSGNKRLIICCDGTWNEPDEKVDQDPTDEPEPTNVLKIARGIAPADGKGITQVVYYDAGVGTQGFFDKYIGGAFGRGLSENIRQTYRFIANNYVEGDELFLFGFSRGAFTVRSLAGFIGAVGLLEKHDLNRVPEAFAYYRNRPEKRASSPQERRLNKRLTSPPRTPIPIKFIGVWDTVGALGIPLTLRSAGRRRKVNFHDTQLGEDVEHAYHALAVDEKRRPFKPTLWYWKVPGGPGKNQTIEQVWFAGVHSNIGGSYRNTGLSDIALKWMARKAKRIGLQFTQPFDDFLNQYWDKAEEGRLEDSYSRWYRKYFREIGPNQFGDIRCEKWNVPGERVHPTAEAAIHKSFAGNANGKSFKYEPKNLMRALEKGLSVWKAWQSRTEV